MLLNEIIANMEVGQRDIRGVARFHPDIEKSVQTSKMGAVKLTMPIPEEQRRLFLRMFKKKATANNFKYPDKVANWEMQNLLNTINNVYVIHPFSLGIEDSRYDRMIRDSLKMRQPLKKDDPSSFIDQDDLAQLMKAGIHKTKQGLSNQNLEQLKKVRTDTKQAIHTFSTLLTNKKIPILIIPIASSSPTVQLLANTLAIEIGSNAKVIDVFSKTKFRSSRYTVSSNPELIQSTRTPLHRRLANAKYDLKMAKRKYDNVSNDPNRSDTNKREFLQMIMADINRYQKIVDQAQQDIDTPQQIKNFNRTFQYGTAGLYGGQKLNVDKLQDLKDANIILVDDNIVKSTTMSNAIKELYLHGIRPKQLFGFVLHRFHQIQNK